MKFLHLATVAFSALALMTPCVEAAEPAPLARANNAFAADLYGALRAKPGNLFFSPVSIATALDMVFAGAGGSTESEMAKVLHVDGMSKSTLLAEAKTQNVLQNIQQDGMRIHVANALWGKAGYPFAPTYIASIKDSFSGNLEPVTFADEPATRAKINEWIADHTANKIQNVIGSGALSPFSRLVLTNAIYFKADWMHPFKKETTQKSVFHVSFAKDVMADMMNQTGSFDFAAFDAFNLLTLPYKGDQVSMVILLPNTTEGLAKIEAMLTADKLTAWIGKANPAKVSLTMPKFKATSLFGLKEKLEGLGMTSAFSSDKADFTAIANVPGERLFIDNVLHKAYVAVDEEGTEAAAATVVTMGITSAARPEEPIPFVADHPFLFLLRANQTGEILFMGRLADPTREE